MPENIVPSLFGLQPWQIQQQQNQGLQSAAEAYGNQTPAQRINSGFYQAGGMLGGAAAQGMGMVNPQIQQAQQMNQFMQGVDSSTPETLRQAALKANQQGLPQVSMILNQQADAKELTMAQAAHAKAQATDIPAMRKEQIQNQYDIALSALYQKADAAKQASEDKQLSIQQRADAAREANATKLQIAQLISSLKSNQLPKLKPGERYTSTGDVEPILGSDLYNKQNQLHGKQYSGVLAIDTKTDNAARKIDSILDPKNTDAFNSNFGGYNAVVTQYLPGAQDMKQNIESIKSDLKSAGLELMRSGGSIGQMTEREWPIVEKMVDSIDPKLSIPEARNKFAQIKSYLKHIQDNSHEVYNSDWSTTPFYKGNKLQPANSDSNEMSALPSPSQLTGKIVRDTVTGNRYKSDGTNWVKQ